MSSFLFSEVAAGIPVIAVLAVALLVVALIVLFIVVRVRRVRAVRSRLRLSVGELWTAKVERLDDELSQLFVRLSADAPRAIRAADDAASVTTDVSPALAQRRRECFDALSEGEADVLSPIDAAIADGLVKTEEGASALLIAGPPPEHFHGLRQAARGSRPLAEPVEELASRFFTAVAAALGRAAPLLPDVPECGLRPEDVAPPPEQPCWWTLFCVTGGVERSMKAEAATAMFADLTRALPAAAARIGGERRWVSASAARQAGTGGDASRSSDYVDMLPMPAATCEYLRSGSDVAPLRSDIGAFLDGVRRMITTSGRLVRSRRYFWCFDVVAHADAFFHRLLWVRRLFVCALWAEEWQAAAIARLRLVVDKAEADVAQDPGPAADPGTPAARKVPPPTVLQLFLRRFINREADHIRTATTLAGAAATCGRQSVFSVPPEAAALSEMLIGRMRAEAFTTFAAAPRAKVAAQKRLGAAKLEALACVMPPVDPEVSVDQRLMDETAAAELENVSSCPPGLRRAFVEQIDAVRAETAEVAERLVGAVEHQAVRQVEELANPATAPWFDSAIWAPLLGLADERIGALARLASEARRVLAQSTTLRQAVRRLRVGGGGDDADIQRAAVMSLLPLQRELLTSVLLDEAHAKHRRWVPRNAAVATFNEAAAALHEEPLEPSIVEAALAAGGPPDDATRQFDESAPTPRIEPDGPAAVPTPLGSRPVSPKASPRRSPAPDTSPSGAPSPGADAADPVMSPAEGAG